MRRSSRSTPARIPSRNILQTTRTRTLLSTRRARRKPRRRVTLLGNPRVHDSKTRPAEHAASAGACSDSLLTPFSAFGMPTLCLCMIYGPYDTPACGPSLASNSFVCGSRSVRVSVSVSFQTVLCSFGPFGDATLSFAGWLAGEARQLCDTPCLSLRSCSYALTFALLRDRCSAFPAPEFQSHEAVQSLSLPTYQI